MVKLTGYHGFLAVTLFLASLAAMPLPASGQGLKEIMRQLEADYNRLNRSILLEEYAEIEAAASRIAEHPTPDWSERLAILARVGSDSGRFKQLDAEMAEAAGHLVQAASDKNMDRVLKAQAQLMRVCMQCHVPFRKKIVAAN